MTRADILISPLKAAIPAQGGPVDLLIRLQAPDPEPDQAIEHLPKRLALVVDRSGSMSGQPLREALRCVMHIANHLTPQDDLSLVVYDDKADVLLPLHKVTSVTDIQKAVEGVREGGSTNLFGGWLAGARQLASGSAATISRVMLLSDGQANAGELDVHVIQSQCKQWLDQGVSTTTVGLGSGFNEDLMIAMATTGGGQQYYGQTAEDLHDSFDQELSLLQALYLRGVALKLVPAPGVIVELLSAATQNPDGSYKMNDLAWGAETWLAVRLHLSPSVSGTLRDLLAVSISGTDLQAQVMSLHSPLFQLHALEQDAYAALAADELVERRLLEVEFGKAADALRLLARQGDIAATRRHLAQMERRFGHHPWLNAKMTQMRRLAEEDMEMMVKEVSYSAMRMSRSLASKSEVLYSVDETAADMPAFLRKKESEGKGRRAPK